MKVRVTFMEIDGFPEVELVIPDTCDSIVYSEKMRDESGKDGWDAVQVFESALAKCLADGIKVDIIPERL